MIITPAQIRAARGLLGWNQQDLAEKAHISIGTVKNFESGKETVHYNSMQSLRSALEAAGIEFLGQNGVQKTK